MQGPSGTTGFAEITIAKDLIADSSKLKVSLNGTDWSYTATSTDGSWRLSFTYPHSVHDIVISLGMLPPTAQIPIDTILITGGIIAVLVVLVLIMRRLR